MSDPTDPASDAAPARPLLLVLDPAVSSAHTAYLERLGVLHEARFEIHPHTDRDAARADAIAARAQGRRVLVILEPPRVWGSPAPHHDVYDAADLPTDSLKAISPEGLGLQGDAGLLPAYEPPAADTDGEPLLLDESLPAELVRDLHGLVPSWNNPTHQLLARLPEGHVPLEALQQTALWSALQPHHTRVLSAIAAARAISARPRFRLTDWLRCRGLSCAPEQASAYLLAYLLQLARLPESPDWNTKDAGEQLRKGRVLFLPAGGHIWPLCPPDHPTRRKVSALVDLRDLDLLLPLVHAIGQALPRLNPWASRDVGFLDEHAARVEQGLGVKLDLGLLHLATKEQARRLRTPWEPGAYEAPARAETAADAGRAALERLLARPWRLPLADAPLRLAAEIALDAPRLVLQGATPDDTVILARLDGGHHLALRIQEFPLSEPVALGPVEPIPGWNAPPAPPGWRELDGGDVHVWVARM